MVCSIVKNMILWCYYIYTYVKIVVISDTFEYSPDNTTVLNSLKAKHVPANLWKIRVLKLIRTFVFHVLALNYIIIIDEPKIILAKYRISDSFTLYSLFVYSITCISDVMIDKWYIDIVFDIFLTTAIDYMEK